VQSIDPTHLPSVLTDENGPVAPDGSPVLLYALLPTDGEPETIHAAVPAGAEILELGAGAGRVTHALLALGHPVVAVDQSVDMLALMRGAETVLADIETLDLRRRFDAVVLGSYLVNTPNDEHRAALLATCRRHVDEDGVVLVERHDPAWAAALTEHQGEHRGLVYAVREVRRKGPLLSAVMHYTVAGRRFRHAFTARILGPGELYDALRQAGLALRRDLPGGRWIEAAPAPAA
jgi:SAM-dependent methyltransferase